MSRAGCPKRRLGDGLSLISVVSIRRRKPSATCGRSGWTRCGGTRGTRVEVSGGAPGRVWPPLRCSAWVSD